MRKLFLSLAGLLFVAGLVVAADYEVVAGSYNKDTRTITLKDKDGKEVKAKLSDKTKVTIIDADGNKKEGKLASVEKAWSGEKAPKKVDVVISGGDITEVTIKQKKKKN